MNEQFEIELPSGRIAIVDAVLELTTNYRTEHWLYGGSVCSCDYIESQWRVEDIDGMCLLTNGTERAIRAGSKLWNTVLRHLSLKIELSL